MARFDPDTVRSDIIGDFDALEQVWTDRAKAGDRGSRLCCGKSRRRARLMQTA
jgi:hypothetical protein